MIPFHLEGGSIIDTLHPKSDTVVIMHAFLLIGSDSEKLKTGIEELAKDLQVKIMEFPLVKIDDVRSLNNLIRLSFEEPTLIVCKNIHKTGDEALNAFLKNLEEPQKNIFFALTAPTTRKVLPTIVSRCQIIKITNNKLQMTNGDAEEFTKMTIGQKLNYIDKIKDRDKAIELAESLVNFLHSRLHKNAVNYDVQANNLEVVSKTLSGLKANGNVNLQLTNMVIKYAN